MLEESGAGADSPLCSQSLYCVVDEDKAWQAELQLENEVSLLFLIFLNILMHNEGPQWLSSADVRAGPPCNCTTVGSSAAAGLLSGGLTSAR